MKIERINENQIRCTLTSFDLSARNINLVELAYGTEKARKLFREMIQKASNEVGFEAEDIPLMVEAIPLSSESIMLVITKIEDPEELDTRFSKFSPSDPDDDYEDYDYPYEDYDSMETIDASAAHALPSANDELNESDTDADSTEDDVLNIFSKLNDYLNKGSASGSKGTGTVSVPAANKPESSADTQKDAPVIRCFSFENLDAFSESAKAVLPVYNDKSHLFKHTNGRYYVFLEKTRCSSVDFNKTCNILSEYGKKEYLPDSSLLFFTEHMDSIIKNRAIQVMAKL
jgi:adapter protein MecA 1/2